MVTVLSSSRWSAVGKPGPGNLARFENFPGLWEASGRRAAPWAPLGPPPGPGLDGTPESGLGRSGARVAPKCQQEVNDRGVPS